MVAKRSRHRSCDAPLFEPAERRRAPIQERFERFHRANPWVLEYLERLAAGMIEKGRGRVSVKMLWEVARWQRFHEAVAEPGDFAFNNDFHARYVRLIVERHPEWRDKFEMRSLSAM